MASPGGAGYFKEVRCAGLALGILLATAGCRRSGEATPAETDTRGAGAPSPVVLPPPSPSTALAPARPPPGPASAGACPAKNDETVGVLTSPRQPVAGRPLRILAATMERASPLSLRVDKGSEAIDAAVTMRDGVPSATLAEIEAPPAGHLVIVVGDAGQGLACLSVDVAARPTAQSPRPIGTTAVWPTRRKWTGAEEALFSAWVREMFHAPRGEELAWKALHEVTSDRRRNILHDHYGWSEDAADPAEGLFLQPDCADTPYFLRAYYSWKRQLPFAFRSPCARDGQGSAPRCGELHGSTSPPEHGTDGRRSNELGVVQKYFRRTLAWGVHSGNGRTAFGDDASDLYPVALTARSLVPGTTYADPYGHFFVLVEHMPKDGAKPGILYAIDGQPDGSITRKRFWEGNFLWNADPALGGSGFKRFRPLDPVEGDGGAPTLHAATDAEIATRPGYGDVSDEQARLTAAAFYDRMDSLVTPGRRDPFVVQAEAVDALFEAALVRATSVHNAEGKVTAANVVPMPDGASIFEATGPWEDYSTPGRDLRILVAIDLVQGFADKVARNPDVFLPEGKTMTELRSELDTARQGQLAAPRLSFSYTRSDGSPWRLTLLDLLARKSTFETGYNPNDCPEMRWGAPAGSEEARPCTRHAPPEQQRKMAAYAVWFKERRRPARGDPGPPVP